MSTRFATNMVLVLIGGLIVVVSQAFASGVVGWVTFGLAVAILLMIAVVQLDRTRGMIQRALDASCGILGIWTIVASLVFTGATVVWLSFAEGIGFAVFALAGLTAHELKTERVVHSLSLEQPRQAKEHHPAAV